MSSLGNIYLSYGSAFNIAIANTYSNVVLTGANLPANTVIISSAIDSSYEDIGSYSLIATDVYGEPVRLTYTVKTGNGLSEDKDIIYLNIDNKYIKDDNGLYIDLSKISADTVYVNEDNKLSINTGKINYASDNVKGIVSIDGKTVNNDNDTLFINTDNLILSNNSTGQYGIISGTDNIINIDNGIVSINEDNLPLAGNDDYGICQGDEYTIYADGESALHVNTVNLDKATNDNYGIIKTDNEKIAINNGIINVNTNKLNKADYYQKGIISIDNNTIKLNDNNQITVNNYENIVNDISYLIYAFNDISEKLNNLKEEILSQING